MLTPDDKYSRQRRLAEIGEAGQQRLFGAAARVAGEPGGMIEAAYLHRAGFGSVVISTRAEPTPFAHARAFRHEAPRAVGAGASRALHEIRRALGLEPGEADR